MAHGWRKWKNGSGARVPQIARLRHCAMRGTPLQGVSTPPLRYGALERSLAASMAQWHNQTRNCGSRCRVHLFPHRSCMRLDF